MRTKTGTPIATRAGAHEGFSLSLDKLLVIILFGLWLLFAYAMPDITDWMAGR